MNQFLDTPFYKRHGSRLVDSFKLLTGNDLVPNKKTHNKTNIQWLDEAPFVVLSHGLEADPIFNYGNTLALNLFETNWYDLLTMPSRLSAETINQTEREHLLNTVNRQGYIDDYSGIRISAKGKRFMINQAIVWNLVDEYGKYCGQAAMFKEWGFL